LGSLCTGFHRDSATNESHGKALLTAIIKEARFIGYSKIRLDSGCFAKEAQALYRLLNFKEIEPYPESELPEKYRSHWVFMELAL
jgi:ribosomal protein S18 acetylase RimI-like enzyme